MFKLYYIYVFICQIFITSVSGRGVDGGMSCAVCTVITGVLMESAEIHNEDFLNGTKRFCSILPEKIQLPCLELVEKTEPYMTNFSQKFTPDLFCLIYGTCEQDESGNFCHLFPLPFSHHEKPLVSSAKSVKKVDFCHLPYIRNVCKILNNSYISLEPLADFDGDGFSSLETGRGSNWRGKDCNDGDRNVYPGRLPDELDFFKDSNCNGIWGYQNQTTDSWENLLCTESQPRGLIYIGDSIGAHFHMPEVWINALIFNLPGLNASNVILNEIDWPQYGFATGFKNITKNILIRGGAVDSLYLRLRARNRCNHRDYQNLSQNGASSYEGLSHVNSISRNQTTDHPAIVVYAMQGNDVCNTFNDTINHMTPPRIFKKNILETLILLDEKLPFGSHVVLIELVRADFIYAAMAERIHPIGKLHQNVFYKNLYDWFNCLQIGPCTGWLNSNETLRDITSLKAKKLNKVLKNIVSNYKFKNFDLHSIKNPINFVVATRKVEIPDLLEAADSLHPNQKAQHLISEAVWNFLTELPGDVLGPINPNNNKIISVFGDQGGH